MNRLITNDIYNALANNKEYVDTINKELFDNANTKNKVPINKDNEEFSIN